MRIGCDIEKVGRVARAPSGFFERFFTQNERDYANLRAKPMESFTGMFCAKEAFLKALGNGFDGSIRMTDIEILHTQKGQPYYSLHNKAKSSLGKNAKLNLTISHTVEDAIAFCLIED